MSQPLMLKNRSWTTLWWHTRPSRTNTKKKSPFIIGDWNAKVGNQEIPGVIGKFGLGVQNEVGQRLIEFCQKNTLVIANTVFEQHKRRLYIWTSPDDQNPNRNDYILCSQRYRSCIQSAKIRPGADVASDHELLTARFRLKLKKVGKTTRPFRYDLNQIPYDYTVQVLQSIGSQRVRLNWSNLVCMHIAFNPEGVLFHCFTFCDFCLVPYHQEICRSEINLPLISEMVFEHWTFNSQKATVRNNFGNAWKFCLLLCDFVPHFKWMASFFLLLTKVKKKNINPINMFPCVPKHGFNSLLFSH